MWYDIAMSYLREGLTSLQVKNILKEALSGPEALNIVVKARKNMNMFLRELALELVQSRLHIVCVYFELYALCADRLACIFALDEAIVAVVEDIEERRRLMAEIREL